jgi:hypothetical protein
MSRWPAASAWAVARRFVVGLPLGDGATAAAGSAAEGFAGSAAAAFGFDFGRRVFVAMTCVGETVIGGRNFGKWGKV